MSEQMRARLEARNISIDPVPPEASWKKGKVERHGDMLRDMVHRVLRAAEVDFDEVMEQCRVATSMMSTG